MTKSQVPRGTTKRALCEKCKISFLPFCEGSSQTPRKLCKVCQPTMEQKK